MMRKLLFLMVLMILAGFQAIAGSQEYFRIARLSYLEGRVSFQHANDPDWAAASINMALQPGDRFYTGDTGRAEIEFDDGSVLRLAEKTDVEILAMKERLIQLKLLVGLCSLFSRSSVEFEINTPAAAFTALEKGSYRFDVAENGDSDGIVRKGEIEAANRRFARRIRSGEILHIPMDENSAEVLSRYDQRDVWDEWNDRRNADLSAYDSRRYLPDHVYVGASDLDHYGRWVMIDGYGYGWVPRVAAYWSPYWEGRWYYRPIWGWTWISYEPWGWLPYHYGRWHHSISFGWCWMPGPSFSFHFWSPGLVRFYRGPSWISWCPLGPGDYYNVNNYYHHTTYNYYVNNLRLLQRRGPDDLVNRAAPGAIRSVRTEQFVDSGLGGRMDRPANAQNSWRGGRIITDSLDVRPTVRSYAPLPDQAAARPTLGVQRPVVVRTEPEVRPGDDRFQRITSGRTDNPRARSENPSGVAVGRPEGRPAGNAAEPARVMRTAPDNAARRTEDIPDRAPARIYQLPQSRAGAGNQGTVSGEVQRNPDRQTAPRTQQPPAVIRNVPDQPARRMDSQEPARRANPPAQSIQRSEQMSPPTQRQPDRPPANRQEVARPPAETRPPTRGDPPPPVKKDPDRKQEWSYTPREKPATTWLESRSPAVRQAPAWSAARNEASQAARSYSSPAPRSYAGGGAVQAMRNAPLASPAVRSAPSSGASRSRSEQPAGRRIR